MDLPDAKPRHGLLEVVSLSWPISLTLLNSTVMRFVDGWFVSMTGPDAVAAQFVGGITSFIPESLASGMVGVLSTYVAQNYGAGRHRRCGQYAWAGMLLGLIAYVLVLPMGFAADPLLRWLYPEHGPAVHQLEVIYFQYMTFAVILTLGARALAEFFYGAHRPRVVLVAAIVANLANLVGDYVLVLGKWGMPAMGLRGAAIATVVGWVLLIGIMMGAFLSQRIHSQFGSRLLRAVRWRHVADLARLGWPAGLQFTIDIVVWTVLVGKLAGKFGDGAIAAGSIAMRYMQLSFMPAVGIGAATAAIVGRYIAQGQPHMARHRAHAGLLIAMVYMGLCGALFLVYRRDLVAFFLVYGGESYSPQAAATVSEIGAKVMICAAVFQLFDAVGIIYLGALRGAGSTMWAMLMTLILFALVVLGGGFAVVNFFPSLGSIGPWIVGTIYVILLGLLFAMRFESGAWRRINLLSPH
ncbi:MAG: MATE family efflux transporter [Planctomycetaceae bacterium]|nr:MATE family efflux transporter [Planctomycetaceae bacterium]